MTSPSSAMRTSVPGQAGPTVPGLMRSGVQVMRPVFSDMPYTSDSGTPMARNQHEQVGRDRARRR